MKIFRSYKNLAAVTVLFASVVGVFAIILIDDISNLRSPLLDNNFLSSFIMKIGVERINFSAKGLACFGFTYIDCLALFYAMLYSKTLAIYFRIRNRKFNMKLFCGTVFLLFLLIFAGVLFFLGMKPYDYLEVSIIYAFFIVFFIVAAAIFVLVCTLVAFISSRITKEKFTFPATEKDNGDLDSDEEIISMAQEASKQVFPDLISIDERYADFKPEKLPACNVLSLKDLSEGFREYAFSKYSVNYHISSIRAFIAGLAMSRLVFLQNEGEDPVRFIRIFSEYLNGICSFIEVQKEWDSDTDVLGYYSEREGQYMCSEFVEKLYEAAYNEEHVNMISFTNMAAAEIFEYFGAILNTLYRNASQSQLNLMRLKKGQYGGKLPRKLVDGSIEIGKNTWLVGILGSGEHERVIAKEMAENFVVVGVMKSKAKISAARRCKGLNMHANELKELFEFANTAVKFKMTVPELETFLSVADYIYDSFNIRIDGIVVDYVQFFVSCYVYCGGSKEEALDIVFLKKIFTKLKGRAESYMLNGLLKLDGKIVEKYGKSGFKFTRAEIKKEILKLNKQDDKRVSA